MLTRCGWLWKLVEMLTVLGHTRQNGQISEDRDRWLLSPGEDGDERRGETTRDENARAERSVGFALGRPVLCEAMDDALGGRREWTTDSHPAMRQREGRHDSDLRRLANAGARAGPDEAGTAQSSRESTTRKKERSSACRMHPADGPFLSSTSRNSSSTW